MQIIRKHWRQFMPGARGLTRDQKREYAVGWLNWLSAESIGVVVGRPQSAWVQDVVLVKIARFPTKLLTIPIIAGFHRHGGALHHAVPPARSAFKPVSCRAWAAAMSVQSNHGPGRRLRPVQGRAAISCGRPRAVRPGRARTSRAWEAGMAGLLLVCAALVVAIQLQAGAGKRRLLILAGGAEPAVHFSGRHRPDRRFHVSTNTRLRYRPQAACRTKRHTGPCSHANRSKRSRGCTGEKSLAFDGISGRMGSMEFNTKREVRFFGKRTRLSLTLACRW